MQFLRLFCDVARHRSFSTAALEHGITQSAASQRISAREKQLGVKLLDRSVRPLALTPAGEMFLDECQVLLSRYDQVAQKISKLGDNPSGPVHIHAIYSAGIELLSNIKEAFENVYPRATVKIRYHRPDEVHDEVRHGECDLGIVSYPQSWRDVGVIPLRDEPMAVVCGPDHALAGGESVQAADLTGLPMLSFEQAMPAGKELRRYLKRNGVTPNITHEFDNIDTLKNAVGVTGQCAILPSRTVRRERAAGTLRVVRLEPELFRPMGIIHRKRNGSGREFSAVVQAFVDYLLVNAGPDTETTQIRKTDKQAISQKTPDGKTPDAKSSVSGVSGVSGGSLIGGSR